MNGTASSTGRTAPSCAHIPKYCVVVVVVVVVSELAGTPLFASRDFDFDPNGTVPSGCSSRRRCPSVESVPTLELPKIHNNNSGVVVDGIHVNSSSVLPNPGFVTIDCNTHHPHAQYVVQTSRVQPRPMVLAHRGLTSTSLHVAIRSSNAC